MKTTIAAAAGAATLLLAGLTPQPAAAAIECRGPDQVVSGSLLSTPYCNDSYIAYVANRFYGMQVSAQAVRQNPSVKQDVCLAIGHDNRISAYCQGSRPEGGRFRDR